MYTNPLSFIHCLRILVYLVIYVSGQVSPEHLLLVWYPSQSLSLLKGAFEGRTVKREQIQSLFGAVLRVIIFSLHKASASLYHDKEHNHKI